MTELKLLGKAIIRGKIKALTGLHVGGTTTGLKVGGVDLGVITDPEGKPYIPGSSLKGKLRSLLEKAEGLATNENRIWVKEGEVSIHMCDDKNCSVCNIFGRSNGKHKKFDDTQFEIKTTTPTRLIVRDANLIEESIPDEIKKNIDLEWTEVKWENAIDRMTSAATPRQIERVPQGAEFEFEMIYSILEEDDKDRLAQVFKAMNLLENDYIGGHGSRGYGQIKFEDIKVYWNSKQDYEKGETDTEEKEVINSNFNQPHLIIKSFSEIKGKLR